MQNRRAVLRLVECEGPIPRVAVAEALGLSQPTVSEVVAELAEVGLVVEAGLGDSTGGRRPVMLRFNDEAAYILAIDLGGTESQLAIFTLGGREIDHMSAPLPRAASAREAVELLGRHVRTILGRDKVSDDRLGAVGVAVPGVVDPVSGEVTFAPALGWREAALRSMLEEELGLPVVIDNDVNAATLAELQFGKSRQYRNFVYVWIGTGVGAGLIVDGKLYRGHGNFAGEIGYMIVGTQDRSWTPAGFGPLEGKVALSHVVERVVGQGAGVLPLSEEDYRAVFERLLKEFEAGQEPALEIVTDLVESLSRALINVMLVVAPDVIFIGGPLGQSATLLIPHLGRRMTELSPIVPELRVASLGENAGLVGAAALASGHAQELILSRLVT